MPELAAMFAEECRRRLDDLRDDSLRQIAILRLEGYTNEEIAGRLGTPAPLAVSQDRADSPQMA